MYHFRGGFRLPWPGAVRGPVDPVDLPPVPLPCLPPSCPVQEGTPLLPLLQVSPPQRYFHKLFLENRKRDQLSSCKICKQTFVDAPNQALEKMVGLIGLPCKYGDRGCTELIFLPSRLQHETLCRFRLYIFRQGMILKCLGFVRLSANSSNMVVSRFLRTR